MTWNSRENNVASPRCWSVSSGCQVGGKFAPCSCQGCDVVEEGLQEPEVCKPTDPLSSRLGGGILVPQFNTWWSACLVCLQWSWKMWGRLTTGLWNGYKENTSFLQILHQYPTSLLLSEITSSVHLGIFFLTCLLRLMPPPSFIFKNVLKAAKHQFYYVFIECIHGLIDTKILF